MSRDGDCGIIEKLWREEFRSACPEPSIDIGAWRYVGAGDAEFLGGLAALGVLPDQASPWVAALSNGYGAHGRTQSRRMLQRISVWLDADFTASEAATFTAAGVRLKEAAKMAE